MDHKVYFAGSIRGGRADAALYKRIIQWLQEHGDDVLTEHVGNLELNALEQGFSADSAIYQQDTAWLRESDYLVAECTNPSLGVGYELAYAEKFGKPCYIFYDRSRTELSAMLTGNPYFRVYPYQTESEIYAVLETLK